MGNLNGQRPISQRLKRLEQEVEAIEPSQTELEVWALDGEMRMLGEEIEALEGPQDGIPTRSERERKRGEVEIPPGLALDEEIRFLEELLEEDERED